MFCAVEGCLTMVGSSCSYFPEKYHAELAPEFLEEMEKYGHIYMYRLRPTEYEMKAYPIHEYPARCPQGVCCGDRAMSWVAAKQGLTQRDPVVAAAAIMMMIQNNLDKRVAQYPHELVTYGGNGSAFSNWAQYRLAMKYLSEMSENQTLVLSSGHPAGCVRVWVVTCGQHRC